MCSDCNFIFFFPYGNNQFNTKTSSCIVSFLAASTFWIWKNLDEKYTEVSFNYWKHAVVASHVLFPAELFLISIGMYFQLPKDVLILCTLSEKGAISNITTFIPNVHIISTMCVFLWRLWASYGITQLDIAKLLTCVGGCDVTLLI